MTFQQTERLFSESSRSGTRRQSGRVYRLLGGLPRSGPAPTRDETRGTDGLVSEARSETVHRAGEALRARHVGLEKGELPAAGGPQHRDGDTDEPHGLRQADAGEERLDPAIDGQAILGRITRLRARDGGEVGEAELERHCPAGITGSPELAGHPLALTPERRPNELDVARILLEGLLGAHGFGRGVGLDRPVVEAPRELKEIWPVRAEAGLQVRGGSLGKLTDGENPHGLELGSRYLAHSPQPPHGQR